MTTVTGDQLNTVFWQKKRHLPVLRAFLLVITGAILIASTTASAGCSIQSPAAINSGPASVNPTPALPLMSDVRGPAPDFVLADTNGKTLVLSQLRGQAVFINFWATWCPPCRAEMPEIEAVYQQYRDKGLVIVGIDMQESPDTVRQFVQQGKFSWTFAIDQDGKEPANYRVFAVPTSFFIDKEGKIRESYIGQMTRSQMEKFIDEVIN